MVGRAKISMLTIFPPLPLHGKASETGLLSMVMTTVLASIYLPKHMEEDMNNVTILFPIMIYNLCVHLEPMPLSFFI